MRTDRVEKPVAVSNFGSSIGPSLKQALLSSIGHHRTILATAMAALLPSAQALAQCAIAPAAVSISSGNCTDPLFTERESAGPAAVVEVSGTGTYSGTSINFTATGSVYGMHATGGGTITLTGTPDNGNTLSTITTYGPGNHALHANGGGLITGDYTAIYTNDAGSYGIGAVGTGSRVTLTDSGVNASGDGSYGAYAAGGGTITLTRTEIQTFDAGASAVFADVGGSIILNGLNTFSGGGNAPGAVASGAGSSLTLNGAFVNTYGDNSPGLFATGGGTIIADGGGSSYTGNYHGLLISNSPAIYALGAGSTIRFAGSGAANTYGADSPGVVAVGGAGIDFSGFGIFTYETNSPGAAADGAGSTVTLTSTILRTTGPSSAGVSAVNAGTIIVTGSEITTGYRNGYPTASGVYPEAEVGLEAHGAEVIGPGSLLRIADDAFATAITTTGNGAIGVLARDGGAAIMTGGFITTSGASTVNATADGVRATGAGSSITLAGTWVTTLNTDAAGLHALQTGTIAATDVTVTTQGQNAFGAHAQDAGSTITLTRAALTTAGDAATGIQAGNAGGVQITGGSVGTAGVAAAGLHALSGGMIAAMDVTVGTLGQNAFGAHAQDAGSTITLTRAVITTAGDAATGVQAGNAGGVQITGGSVDTAGIAAVGLHALSGGMIAATDVTVTTQGQNAQGIQAQDAGGAIALTRVAITTAGDAAAGVEAGNAGTVRITGGSVTTTGSTAHGIAAINGGTLGATGTAVAVTGAGSAAIYLAGSAPSAVSITGGSLSATSGALVLAEGGTGTVSIGGGTTLTPAVVNGRPLLAWVTEDVVGTPANLTLTISGMPALAGDVVVDPSTLTYNLSNSRWTGNLVLTGPGNTATANLAASQWTGDLLADAGNTAQVALAQGSLWAGLARNATNVAIDAGSAWNVTGDSSATGVVTNAGLIQFLARDAAHTVLSVGSYAGNNGRIGFNTYLGTDNSPSNLLVINGGAATGSTTVLIANTGGPGALTTADGIRLVQVTGGGTTAAGAFTLGQRVAAGAYEYRLFRGGSTDPNDWFLRSTLIPAPSDPASPASPPSAPEIPLYRPEVVLYAPIPAIGRQMGLATLGTLHERVGEEENIRGLTGSGQANGGWARAIGERTRNRWAGTVDSRATANIIGLQAGFDIIRTNPYAGGHRDHLGVYVAYADYNAPTVRGFALGQQTLGVGRLLMSGLSAGAYWTHFGPSGWYVDAVFQASWYEISARSDFGTGLGTNATGYTASLKAGYPIRFGEGDRWQIEPQAQIIYQTISVDRARDAYSTVNWDEGDAWTGRLGARLQYTGTDAQGTLWQPYARLDLWHAFSGDDGAIFGQSSSTIETRFGDTALEVGGGVTARVSRNLSFYGQASYRWSLGGGRSRQIATAGTIGLRFNW